MAPADSECLYPIDDLLNIKEDCFACYENEKVLSDLVSPHLATTKGNVLMSKIIDKVFTIDKDIEVPWRETGNLLLTNTIGELGYPIKIYPSYYFIPRHYSGIKYIGEGRVYADHKWLTSGKEMPTAKKYLENAK